MLCNQRHCVLFLGAALLIAVLPVPCTYGNVDGAVSTSPKSSSWLRVTEHASWSPRYYPDAVVFKNNLWILGGSYGFSDVCYSPDGENWHAATPNGGWYAGYGIGAAVFLDKLWVLTGNREVWSSEDGVTWTQITANAPWTNRGNFAVAVYAGKLWLLGGRWNMSFNDVWSSLDGVTWNEVTPHAQWEGRDTFQAVVFGDRLWILAGDQWDPSRETFLLLNDVWSTIDGVNWTPAPNPPWHARSGHAAISYGNRVWLFGGSYPVDGGKWDYSQALNDVWWTTDFVNWTQAPMADWSPRDSFGAAAFHGNLYVLGGYTETDFGANDVWRMPVGEDITLSIETGHGPWYQVGEPLDLKVVSTGLSGDETYHWQKDGAALTDATNTAYHLDSLSLSDAGSYACLVTDPANTGTLTAGPVSIIVLSPGYRLPLMSVIGVLLIMILAAIGVRAINSRRA